MTNRSRKVGTEAETRVAEYLTLRLGRTVERRARRGNRDAGDIAGIDGTVVEVKAEKAIAMAEYVDEAAAERINAGAVLGVVFAKRRGRASPGDWYFLTDGRTGAAMLRVLTSDPELMRRLALDLAGDL